MPVSIERRRTRAALVIFEPQLRIAQHAIGAGKLLHAALGQETLLFGGVEEAIRMPFFCQRVIAMANLVIAGGFSHTQDVIVILLFVFRLQFRHLAPPGLLLWLSLAFPVIVPERGGLFPD